MHPLSARAIIEGSSIAELCRILADGGDQSEYVQREWAQLVHQTALATLASSKKLPSDRMIAHAVAKLVASEDLRTREDAIAILARYVADYGMKVDR